ncbi:MAG: peptidoglycan-binding protein, partial [Angelakisella sp.]
NVARSYPGRPLTVGDSGNDVLILQRQLNRINQNFPTVKRMTHVDGVFDPETEESVRSFQKTFNLPVDGKVGKATWYKVKDVYNAVKKLNELSSEGVSLEEIEPVFAGNVGKGDRGLEVQAIQYYIDVLGYFNGNLPLIAIDGIYGDQTENAVKQFQKQYGLTVNGVVDTATRNKLLETYNNLIAAAPKDLLGRRATLYPGYILTQSFENDDVTNLQKYLNAIRAIYPSIPPINPTGYFGPQTEAAVRAFQQIFGLPVNGRVGPAVWNRLAIEYNQYLGLDTPATSE